MGLWPLLPGFIRQIRGTSNYSGWDHLYEISYFAGFVISFTVYWLLNISSPVPGRRGNSPFLLKKLGVLAELDDGSSGLEDGQRNEDFVVRHTQEMEGKVGKDSGLLE